jgi:hypothetical protein
MVSRIMVFVMLFSMALTSSSFAEDYEGPAAGDQDALRIEYGVVTAQLRGNTPSISMSTRLVEMDQNNCVAYSSEVREKIWKAISLAGSTGKLHDLQEWRTQLASVLWRCDDNLELAYILYDQAGAANARLHVAFELAKRNAKAGQLQEALAWYRRAELSEQQAAAELAKFKK